MIPEAVLYFASPDDAHAARTPVSRHPVVFRTLMAAVRAGCRRAWVPAALRADVEPLIATRPSARAAVAWLEADTPPPASPLLLLPAAALAPSAALVPLLVAPAPAVLAASQSEDAPIAVLAADRACSLWPALAAGGMAGDAIERELKDAAVTSIAGGWYAAVRGPRGAARAETLLWSSLGSAIDTSLDRAFHRRLSRHATRLAVACGLSPNAVTLASLGLGLAGAWCFLRGSVAGAVAGLALYAAAVVLDHADGEVARLTLTESAFGSRLDVAVDTIVHAVLMLALGVTAQHVAGGGAALAGAVAAAGVALSSLITQTSPPAGASGMGAVLDALSNRHGFYLSLLLFVIALALRPTALPALMLLLAAGCHAFWVGRLAHHVWTGRRPDGDAGRQRC